jgi:hypothetical protein
MPSKLEGDDAHLALGAVKLISAEPAFRGFVFDGFHLHRATGQEVHQKDDDVALLAAFLVCRRGGDGLVGGDVDDLLPGDTALMSPGSGFSTMR